MTFNRKLALVMGRFTARGRGQVYPNFAVQPGDTVRTGSRLGWPFHLQAHRVSLPFLKKKNRHVDHNHDYYDLNDLRNRHRAAS